MAHIFESSISRKHKYKTKTLDPKTKWEGTYSGSLKIVEQISATQVQNISCIFSVKSLGKNSSTYTIKNNNDIKGVDGIALAFKLPNGNRVLSMLKNEGTLTAQLIVSRTVEAAIFEKESGDNISFGTFKNLKVTKQIPVDASVVPVIPAIPVISPIKPPTLGAVVPAMPDFYLDDA